MNIFLEKCNLTKTNSKRHLETLNSLINIKEIDSTIKNFPTNQTPVLDDFTGKFYQIFKEEITHYYMNSSGKQKKKKKRERERDTPLKSKPCNLKMGINRSILLMNMDTKILTK